MTALFGIAGWKNSGKTTLTARLIAILAGRGYRVSSVKHAHHDFDIDKEGTDSYRHRKAGAGEVAIVSSRRWAMIHELRDEPEPALEDIVAHFSPADLILVEGYKRQAHPKIELRRRASTGAGPLAPTDPSVVAIAADHETDAGGLPLLSIDDVEGIADFIAAYLKLDEPADAP